MVVDKVVAAFGKIPLLDVLVIGYAVALGCLFYLFRRQPKMRNDV